jgi:hypothetical protein
MENMKMKTQPDMPPIPIELKKIELLGGFHVRLVAEKIYLAEMWSAEYVFIL